MGLKRGPLTSHESVFDAPQGGPVQLERENP